METIILLSLSPLLCLLLFCAFRGVSFLTSVINGSLVLEESSARENDNGYSKPTGIFIPNVLARWPWRRRVNPSYAAIKKEADDWITSFRAFNPKAQDAFDGCDFNLLSCLLYPGARKEHARAGCDLMRLLWVFDKYSDRSAPPEVSKKKDVIMDAFRNPHTPRPKGEWIGGEVARQFWERTIQNATTVSQKRFIRTMDEYLGGVVQESIDREDHRILDVKGYIDARRRTSGVRPSFSIIELGLDIPDEVMAHPAIQEMVLAAMDMTALWNDIVAYNLERTLRNDLHNIITCVMHERHTDVNGAILWTEYFLLGVADRFQAALAALPEWEEPLNSQVKEYCEGLGQFVRGHEDWGFVSERYFGNKGLEIKANRWIPAQEECSGEWPRAS